MLYVCASVKLDKSRVEKEFTLLISDALTPFVSAILRFLLTHTNTIRSLSP